MNFYAVNENKKMRKLEVKDMQLEDGWGWGSA